MKVLGDGQGGCDWGADCKVAGCCTHKGFKCVEKSAYWHQCEASSDDDGGNSDDENVDECSEPETDCTESNCCSDDDYACRARTDGMWFQSTCVEKSSDDSGDDNDNDDDDSGNGGGVLIGQHCGQELLTETDVKQRWAIAERCSHEMIRQMSKDDKLRLLHGSSGGLGYAGYISVQGIHGAKGKVRLTMNDGPQGYNGYTDPTIGKSTQFPDLIAVAASFDTETAAAFGAAIAEEFRTKGCSVLLGPDVEVARVQLSGRTFESLTGEDPYLGSQLGAAYVREVQSRGLIATVKHWLDNNQEKNRQELDVDVSDRAQHEVYMLPFKAAIDAGAGAVMCSYNKVYGEYACENSKLLRKLLREDLGFKGFVVSDWGAVHSGKPSAEHGLNVEMPEAKYYSNLGSELSQGRIDELSGQVLTAVYAAGQIHGQGPTIDWSWPPPYFSDTTSAKHNDFAKRVIIESTVLLKNHRSILPVKSGSKILLVGKACHDEKDSAYSQGSMFSAGGSGYAATNKAVTPYQGLKDAVSDSTSVDWIAEASGDLVADVAVVCVAAHEEEGQDRKDLTLPKAQEMVDTLKAESGIKAIVVLAIVPGAITTEWIESADAALVMFMPGERIGPAFADILLGKASPNGRLPVSFPKQDEKRFTSEQYPGVNLKSSFSEGVLVGYRWNEAQGVPSAFPFGFGLSYTSFRFSGFQATCDGQGVKISLQSSNVGENDGATVPQIYVGYESLKPVVKQLRGFKKVHLAAGASEDIAMELSEFDLSYYDEPTQGWRSAWDKGETVTITVGSSATDVLWTTAVTCDKK